MEFVYYWLIAVAVFLILEIITTGLTSIWFSLGALVAFFVGLFGANIWVQTGVFIAVTALSFVFTRPIVERHLNHSREKTNLDSLIGKSGKVIEEIDRIQQKGKILLNGMEWTARSENDEVIPVDTIVLVKQVEGAHVIVRTKKS